MGTALPFIFASQKRSLAKTQRVDERASLIYKTAFLLIQKIGPKVAMDKNGAGQEICAYFAADKPCES
jgi:hypothetical protein